MSAPVFVVEAGWARDVPVGGHAVLTGSEGRHAATVQRRTVGEEIEIVDGAGTRWRTTVAQAGRAELTLQIAAVAQEAPAWPRITLVQALVKGGGDEQAITAATETGVDSVVPWQANRSISKWQSGGVDKSQRAYLRWQVAVREAAKQARRAYVPDVGALLKSPQLAKKAAEVVANGGLVLAADETATQPIAPVVSEWAAGELETQRGAAGAGEVWCIIGPEGGIAPDEIAALTAAGAQPVLLGPHVMRAVTAGPVAVALIRAATSR